jgi:hypothetical protein
MFQHLADQVHFDDEIRPPNGEGLGRELLGQSFCLPEEP